MYDIVIKDGNENQDILILENGILTEKISTQNGQDYIEGNIYMGKVQNVITGLQAAFVDIGEDRNAFIHLKDILPKVDETSNEVQINTVDIKDVVKPGMPLLVQIKRAESDKKGARVSTHISLSGKYAVLMPNVNFITISQKIEDEKECNRLKEIFKKLLPSNMGAIVRTSAKGKTEEILKEEIDSKIEEWNEITKKANKQNNIPYLVHEGNGIMERIFNDYTDKDINSIMVENEKTYEDISERIKKIGKSNIKVTKTISNYSDIEKQIDEMDKRKIWLKCGGFITIDKTEALTAIDVNSGKYIGTKNLEQTVYTVNKEATVEIAKQLKLRDIGGIIIIDYIDMNEQSNKESIEKLLKEELKKDRSKTQIMGFTKLNLLEMTRKHIS